MMARNGKRTKKRSPEAPLSPPAISSPRISVIMAVRGEGPDFSSTLDSLAAQDLDLPWELIVAVAPGEDETRTRLGAFAKAHPQIDLRVVDNPGLSAAAGLNRALKEARADSIARWDGHTLASSDYLRRVCELLDSSAAACVGGMMRIEGRGPVGRAFAALSGSAGGTGASAHRREGVGCRPADTVYLGAWPRTSFERFGAFDESLRRNQDDELAMRIREGGGLVLLSYDLRSRYRPRETLLGIWRQHWGYGFFKPAVLLRHRSMLRLRHLAPASLVTLLVVLPRWVGPPYGLLLFAQALRLWRRGAGASPLSITGVALAMHLSYGLGFWAGLPAALGRRRIARLPGAEVERRRILAEFARRDEVSESSPAFDSYQRESRWRSFRALLPGGELSSLSRMEILEIGCGVGGWLLDFAARGVAPEGLHGIDLSPARIAKAQEALPAVDLRVGRGSELPYAEGSFDLVVLSTVLSSILDEGLRGQILSEARRVSRRWLLVHDMSAVRPGASLAALGAVQRRRLFGGRSHRLRRAILAPPLSRPLSRVSMRLCLALERWPGLRCHFTLLEEAGA